MHPFLTLRAAAVAATLLASPLAFAAAAPDPAAEQLALTGAVHVRQVGRYVEQGTLQIQVSTKLGRPTTILPDGTWLYDNWAIDESEARGTLVVRFNNKRVSSLALVTRAAALALRSSPSKPVASHLVATQ